MSKLAAAGLSRTVAWSGAGRHRRPVRRQRLAGDGVGDPHGGLERWPPLGPGEAGRPEPALEVRAALADQHGRDGPLGHDRRRDSDRSTPLSRPPAMSTIGASNARRAAMTASGWVPLRVVDEADAVDRRPRARGGARRRGTTTPRSGSPSGSRPNSSPTATAARALETLCAPGTDSSSTGMIRPSVAAGRGTCRRPPPGAGTSSATIQPSTTPRPCGGGLPRR